MKLFGLTIIKTADVEDLEYAMGFHRKNSNTYRVKYLELAHRSEMELKHERGYNSKLQEQLEQLHRDNVEVSDDCQNLQAKFIALSAELAAERHALRNKTMRFAQEVESLQQEILALKEELEEAHRHNSESAALEQASHAAVEQNFQDLRNYAMQMREYARSMEAELAGLRLVTNSTGETYEEPEAPELIATDSAQKSEQDAYDGSFGQPNPDAEGNFEDYDNEEHF